MSLLILLAMASTFWSIEPGDTLRRSIGLLGTTIAGLYIGTHFSPRQQIHILAVCIAIAAILSFGFGLGVPSIGRDPDGLWQGIFFQKNTLGRTMCLGIVCYSFIALSERRYRLPAILMIPFCGVLILLSGSITSAGVAVGMLVLLAFKPILRWPMRRLIAFGVTALAIGVPSVIWGMNHIDSILKLVGKNTTLTGRLPLWHLIRTQIDISPWFGSGYAAFWSTPTAERFKMILNWTS